MIVQYKYLYLQQSERREWNEREAESLEQVTDDFARAWEYFVPNCHKILIALDNRLQGIIQVDSAGRLVYESGTDVRILLIENVRIPEPLNLLPPELRRII